MNMKDGTALRELRRMAAWSLEQTCRSHGGIDISRLSKFERGIAPISDQQRQRLERVLRERIASATVPLN